MQFMVFFGVPLVLLLLVALSPCSNILAMTVMIAKPLNHMVNDRKHHSHFTMNSMNTQRSSPPPHSSPISMIDPMLLQFPIYPFTRPLTLSDKGKDVFLLQLLLLRHSYCHARYGGNPTEFMSGIFTDQTLDCLIQFMASQHLVPLKHELTPQTAFHLLLLYSYDQYKDEYVKFNSKLNESGHGGEWMNSTLQLPQPYKYYVHVPVYSNRSIETTCSLFDKFGNKRHFFTCRTHGQQNFNEFTSDGNTPTGLYTFDLNTPEDDPKEYGPYDVNRAVYGLKGNAFYIYPKIRSGILLHTGEWSSYHPMPNSHGCIHAQPQDIERIAQILKNDLGVVAHENLFGKYPYPFQQQGLLSVVQYSHDDEL